MSSDILVAKYGGIAYPTYTFYRYSNLVQTTVGENKHVMQVPSCLVKQLFSVVERLRPLSVDVSTSTGCTVRTGTLSHWFEWNGRKYADSALDAVMRRIQQSPR